MENKIIFWRVITILLILISILILIGATWFEIDPWPSSLLWTERWDRQPSVMFQPETRLNTLMSILSPLFSLIISGVFALYLIPDRIRNMCEYLNASPGRYARLALIGLMIGLLVVLVGIGSAFAMTTFPLLIIIGGAVFLIGFLGFFVLAYSFGHGLLNRSDWVHLSPIYALFLGLLILYSFAIIPYVGILLRLIYAFLGVGLVIATRFGSGKKWNLDPLLEDNYT
jgi:MFS family permease